MTAAERIRVTYLLTCAAGEEPEAKARDIAREQTVELPEGGAPAAVERQIVGTVETVEPIGERWRVSISYDPVLVDGDLPQLLNLLFGNISLKAGIEVADLALPPAILEHFGGPRFGIAGVRAVSGVTERPLVCTAVKPVGLSAQDLAELCYRFARAGIDIVKDDHSVADQRPAPFTERVARCQDAVARANRDTGGRALYFPNVTGPLATLNERIDVAVRAGCRGAMVSPLALGLDAVRLVAEHGLVVFSHPTLTGVFFHEGHGVAPHILLGTLFRLAGSDGVIYTNAGGRFPFPVEHCEAINRRLREPLGQLRPAFPVPGGGVDAARVTQWVDRYGMDTVFLVGSSLYAQPDPEAAARRLVGAVKRHCHE